MTRGSAQKAALKKAVGGCGATKTHAVVPAQVLNINEKKKVCPNIFDGGSSINCEGKFTVDDKYSNILHAE